MSKLPELFQPRQVLFLTIILALISCHASYKTLESKTHEIVIEGTSGDSLILNPSGTVEVHKKDIVEWSITAANVKSFKIENKEREDKVFSEFDKPPRHYTRKGSGKVKAHAPEKKEYYRYSIHWKDTSGEEHTFDPVISINPD